MKIHILFENISAVVGLFPITTIQKKYFKTEDNRLPKNIRIMVFDSKKTNERILDQEDISLKLRDEDIEVDIETSGKIIKKTSNLLVSSDFKPVYSYQTFDTLNKDGNTQTRPHIRTISNINSRLPVKITENLYEPSDLTRRFIFRKSYLITHSDGATYKFLYDIAKNLDEHRKFARLQAFNNESKSPESLILISGTRPFAAAFIEGRTLGDKYYLAVHLSDRELTPPKKAKKTKKSSSKAPKKISDSTKNPSKKATKKSSKSTKISSSSKISSKTKKTSSIKTKKKTSKRSSKPKSKSTKKSTKSSKKGGSS